jgi:hypothetical protein
MKTIRINLLGVMLMIALFSACKKENNNINPNAALVISTDEGASFEAIASGNSEKLSGASVVLGNGQLLNNSFYRQFTVGTNKGDLAFRFSFPSSMIGKAEANMYKEHTLYEYTLSLQETGNLTDVVAESYFSGSSTFFYDDNAEGKIILRGNYTYAGIKYSVFGEVDMIVTGKDNKNYTIKGVFWKK